LNFDGVQPSPIRFTIVCRCRFLQVFRPEMSMTIYINGERQAVEAPLTVAELLARLGFTGQRVAVEINREIVPKSIHASHRLRADDRVEVVRAIGGG